MSEIEEKIAEIINEVHKSGYRDILIDEMIVAKEILSLIQIEVKCPEYSHCNGEGWKEGFEQISISECTCNGTGKKTKFPESRDEGRIL